MDHDDQKLSEMEDCYHLWYAPSSFQFHGGCFRKHSFAFSTSSDHDVVVFDQFNIIIDSILPSDSSVLDCSYDSEGVVF